MQNGSTNTCRSMTSIGEHRHGGYAQLALLDFSLTPLPFLSLEGIKGNKKIGKQSPEVPCLPIFSVIPILSLPSAQFVDCFGVFTVRAELHVGSVELVDGELEENRRT